MEASNVKILFTSESVGKSTVEVTFGHYKKVEVNVEPNKLIKQLRGIGLEKPRLFTYLESLTCTPYLLLTACKKSCRVEVGVPCISHLSHTVTLTSFVIWVLK